MRPLGSWFPDPDFQKHGFVEVGSGFCFLRGDSVVFQTVGIFPTRPIAGGLPGSGLFSFFCVVEGGDLSPMIFEPWLDGFYIRCCENDATRHALIKG